MSASSFGLSEMNEKVIDDTPIKLSFCRVYCNAMKYYHRLLSVFIGCPTEESWSRSGKAVILSTQAFILFSIVGLWIAFEGMKGVRPFTFIMMRLIQLTFGFIKPIGTSKMIFASSALACGAIYGLCNIIAYIAMKDDFRPRRVAAFMLIAEFVVWETLFMPFLLAIACMINPKVANYLQALKIDTKKTEKSTKKAMKN